MEQGELFEGQRRRDEGKAKVASHNGEWLVDARREAARICATRGKVSAADLRRWADRTGNHPDHPNAWGTVFRGSEWVATGDWVPCQHASGHARHVRVWTYRSTVY